MQTSEKKSFLTITNSDVDKPSRIKHLFNAVFKDGITSIKDISTISEKIRNELDERFEILSLIEKKRVIAEDRTVKFLFELNDGLNIESVFLIDHNNRITLCISTQVGCRMGCAFCKTASMGLKRNLTSHEIVSQVIYCFGYVKNELKIKFDTRIFNIVFMGMGEPFDNFQHCMDSISILTDKRTFSLHPSWITVSTCGITNMIEPALQLFPRLRIAVSLNCAVNETRLKIMPITKSYSVQDIHNMLYRVYQQYKRRITLEYVLIKNVNDSESDIEALKLFKHKAFHINIIPLNDEINNLSPPTDEKVQEFRQKLTNAGLFVTVRIRRGGDIQADCGQLYIAEMSKTNH